MNPKSIQSAFDNVSRALMAGCLIVGFLLSSIVFLVSLPDHLSDVEPLLDCLGFSQAIIFIILLGVFLEYNEQNTAAQGQSSKALSQSESSPEGMLEEDEEEEHERSKPPEEQAEELLRRSRRRPPKVDESE